MREEERKNEIIDIWISYWKSGNLGEDYTRAREFRDFWINKHPGLGIISALKLFSKEN